MTTGPAVSTMFFTGSGLTDAQAANTAVGAFWNSLTALYPGYGVATTEDQATELTSTGGLVALFGVTPIAHAGSNNSDALPPQVQGLLRCSTGVILGGRQVKGHVFIPGACENHNAPGGVPAEAYKVAVAVAADGLIGAAIPWIVWSRRYGAQNPIISGSCSSKWGDLRSRRD